MSTQTKSSFQIWFLQIFIFYFYFIIFFFSITKPKMQLDVGNEPYLSQQKSHAYSVYCITCTTEVLTLLLPEIWIIIQWRTGGQTESDAYEDYEPTVQYAQVDSIKVKEHRKLNHHQGAHGLSTKKISSIIKGDFPNGKKICLQPDHNEIWHKG